MPNKKIECEYCGQLVWEDRLTILDLSGWSMDTGDPVAIHKTDSRLTKILCKECLKKKVFAFLRENDRNNRYRKTIRPKEAK